jgi:hypothetical protein
VIAARLAIALAACGGATKPAATAPPQPAPAKTIAPVDTRLPEHCEIGKTSFALDAGRLAIATCTIEVHENPGGLKDSDMEAYLLREGSSPSRLGGWNQGWEWASNWTIAGTLQGRGGGLGVVFLLAGSGSDGGVAETVHAWQRRDRGWTELWTEGGNFVKLEIAGDEATVKICETPQMSTCTDPVAKNRVVRLRWNGRELERIDDDGESP